MKTRTAAILSHILLVTPIWYVLIYLVLDQIGADRLMWALYWLYLPITTFERITWASVQIHQDKKLQDIKYDLLYTYAAKHGVDYNTLCNVVRAATPIE